MKKLLVAMALATGIGLGIPAHASAHVFFGFSVPGVSLYVSPPSPFDFVPRPYVPPPAYYRPRVVYEPGYYYPPPPVYRPRCHEGWGHRDWDDD